MILCAAPPVQDKLVAIYSWQYGVYSLFVPRANFIVQRKYSVDVSWSTSLRASYVRTHDPISIRRTVQMKYNEREIVRTIARFTIVCVYDRSCLRSLVFMIDRSDRAYVLRYVACASDHLCFWIRSLDRSCLRSPIVQTIASSSTIDRSFDATFLYHYHVVNTSMMSMSCTNSVYN